MAITNSFRPTALSFNSYGWTGSPQYNRADVPTQWVEGATAIDRTVLEQQLAYEWLRSDAHSPGGVGLRSTNPPFTYGSAGRILPGLIDDTGRPARILRGFIRRSEYDTSDAPSMARLYFMYNPEKINRQYVSYLDQGALDPFNTVYQSGNLVAPPSYMDFSFSLFFDRQEESQDPTWPGVFVDYQYFDLVVRNVTPPSDVGAMSNSLPDNGVMMINPRDITVVFSPQITVQGRPMNANVSFEKFTHRMVPTRMQIDLTMRVTYFGPLKDQIPYTKDETITAATVQWNDPSLSGMQLNITNEDVLRWQTEQKIWGEGVRSAIETAATSAVAGAVSTNLATQNGLTNAGTAGINAALVEWGKTQITAAGGQYGYNGDRAGNLFKNHTCSAYIYGCYAYYPGQPAGLSFAEQMGWPKPSSDPSKSNPNDSAQMLNLAKGGKSATRIFGSDAVASGPVGPRSAEVLAGYSQLQKGDLIFRSRNIGSGTDSDHGGVGHIAFMDHWDSPTDPSAGLWISDSASPKLPASEPRKITIKYLSTDYNWAFRPNLVGANMVANNAPTDSGGT